jgi:OOP family OmpA-OmpF porin
MISVVLLWLTLAAAPPPNPSAQQIIDQLAPPASERVTGVRTRSLRNLAPAARAIDMNVQFEFASARITGEGSETLRQLAIAMKAPQLSSMRFMIEGHTDAKGTAKYNLDLSGRRAQSVVAYLRSQGIDTTRLESVGKGFNELLNEDDPLAAENRRVRIVALSEP